MTDAAAAAASATGAEGTETVESLQAKLDAATKDAEKWKAMSRKNEDDKKANAEAAKERDALTAKLQAAEDAKLSETDQLKKQLEAVNARVEASEKATKAAEITAMRARIGAEKGLPPAFIGRLTGEDADTIGAGPRPVTMKITAENSTRPATKAPSASSRRAVRAVMVPLSRSRRQSRCGSSRRTPPCRNAPTTRVWQPEEGRPHRP